MNTETPCLSEQTKTPYEEFNENFEKCCAIIEEIKKEEIVLNN